MSDDSVQRRGEPAPGATYTIFLRDFTAAVSVRGEPDRLTARFNLRLSVAHPGPGFPDSITAVMSYEDIVEDLRRLCGGPAVPGPAELAEQAAALCLERPKVRQVEVEVELRPGGAARPPAGVSISRNRPDAA